MTKGQELLEEMKTVVSGKTLDALFPPLLFVAVNNFLGLDIAVTVSLALAFGIGILRVVQKQTWQYALGGLLGVASASAFAYLTSSAENFFIPAIVGSAALLFIAVVSLIVDKPMVAWVSHLTRGWPLEWFWRKDIKPAYREVTWLWTGFFLVRLVVHLFYLQMGDATRLLWVNTLLGWPLIIPGLIVSYIYGIWRLRNLGGPGVEEFQQGKEKPWNGQVRGF